MSEVLMTSNSSLLPCIAGVFNIVSKRLAGHKLILPCFLLRVCHFSPCVYNCVCLESCVWYEEVFRHLSFACEYPVAETWWNSPGALAKTSLH